MNIPASTRAGAAVRRQWFKCRCRLQGPSLWRNARGFCLFVGYGGSGHSAIASIIDAHPRAAVAHELDAVARYLAGVSREELFSEIVWLAREQARAGRTTRAHSDVSYHRIEGRSRKDSSQLLLLGDQRGARTLRAFARSGFQGIEDFRTFVGLPVKMLHVIRNPFDVVAAGLARGSAGFPELVALAAEMRQRYLDHGWLDVYHEDVIAHPRREIERIIDFLELPACEAHLARCEGYLSPPTRLRRFTIDWPAGLRTRVEQIIQRHEFLHRYNWDH